MDGVNDVFLQRSRVIRTEKATPKKVERSEAFSLDESGFASIVFPRNFGGIAQLVERVVRNDEAWGSNPHTSTNFASAKFK